MKRSYLQNMILSGTLVFSLGACAHKSPKTTEANSQVETAAPPPQNVLLVEARSEAENMRAELAGLKILMAKQAGELQSLREQTQSVHHRERDQGQELQNVRSQLLSSQAERDQLRKHNVELEAQVASTPDTSQLISDIQALRSSFQTMMSSVKRLVSDITLIKQEMRITTNTLKPQQTKLTTSVSSRPLADPQPPDAKGNIIIQEGDTLWKLSLTHNVSVEQLREWNNLTTDLILTGQPLQVTQSMETVEAPFDQPKPTTGLPIPMAKENLLDADGQESTLPAPDTQVESPSEPNHILSIGSSQSDSPE